MGNCLRHESQADWAGEDWSPAMMTNDDEKSEELQFTNNKKGEINKVKEIKIKITKKQLEKLLGKMDLQQNGFSTEEVLGQLFKVSVHCETHHRAWKPRLHSIPEI